jgi:hypothetical protein
MTQSDSDNYRSFYNRKYYLQRRDKIIAYQKQYAKDNREHINEMQRERRKRKAMGIPRQKDYRRPSTDYFEGLLPPMLYVSRMRLREEYLKIPILERPIYDYFLRCKTIEHLIQKRREQHERNK